MRTDLDQTFDPLDLIEGPDLRAEIERRAATPSPVMAPLSRRRRVTAAVVAVSLFAAVAVFAWAMLSPLGTTPRPSPATRPAHAWQVLSMGWTPLPKVPAPLQGSVRIWAGGALIVWGGNDGDGSGQSALGWRLDAANGPWRPLAPAPLAPRSWAASAWTGSELLIWGGASGADPMSGPLSDGAAYDPANDTWRMLPEAPIGARSPLASVWTGSQWLIWGEGPSRSSGGAMDGAAFQPSTDTWSTIPKAPLRIDDGHAVWTGTEMVVFGGEFLGEFLGGNPAPTAIGGGYDPTTGTWRQLPPTNLNPLGTAWDGSHVIAADNLAKLQSYDPYSNVWTDLPDPPLPRGEGSPSLVVAGGHAIEELNGQTVMLAADGSRWIDIAVRHQGAVGLISAGRFAIGFAASDPRAWAYLPPSSDTPTPEPSGATVAPKGPPLTGTIAFIQGHQGPGPIALLDPASGTSTQLTHRFYNSISLAWSPDRSQIAMSRAISEGTGQIVVVSSATGQILHTLPIAPTLGPQDVSWSPDGHLLAFTDSRARLNVIGVDGSGLRHIDTGRWRTLDIAWAPDGGKIAFTGDQGILGLVDPETGQTDVVVSPSSGRVWYGPAWSPDGRTLAFSMTSGTGSAIFTIGRDGKNLTQLTEPSINATNPAWSPDGNWIAFEAHNSKDLYAVTPDGTDLIRFVHIQGSEYGPAWG